MLCFAVFCSTGKMWNNLFQNFNECKTTKLWFKLRCNFANIFPFALAPTVTNCSSGPPHICICICNFMYLYYLYFPSYCGLAAGNFECKTNKLQLWADLLFLQGSNLICCQKKKKNKYSRKKPSNLKNRQTTNLLPDWKILEFFSSLNIFLIVWFWRGFSHFSVLRFFWGQIY